MMNKCNSMGQSFLFDVGFYDYFVGNFCVFAFVLYGGHYLQRRVYLYFLGLAYFSLFLGKDTVFEELYLYFSLDCWQSLALDDL